MINVAVNGYGTIGKRVADAIIKQPDMKLVGVAKTSPNYEAFIAHRRGIRIYVPQQSIKKFEESGIPVAGTVEDLIKTSDIVVDTTPNGVGAQYKPIYLQLQRNAIFQGGEKAEVADISFSALCNYNEALGKKYIRVVSCNTTALLRTICTVNKVSKVEKVRATIVRRAADQKEVKKGPINSLVPDPATVPSHHAKDVNSVIRNLDIATMAVIAPTTLMHMHFINITLKDKVEKKDILSVLENTPRIVLISSKYDAEATAELVEVARDLKRDRNDIPEVMIFSDSIYVKDDEVMLMYAVHQESIVVPENIDAIRASMKLMSAEDSMRITNESLGILKGYLI
ncbi:phosphorylating glyceraldehyde-3-phosphate dehydrogenase [Saccharolobus solfataricus]|uniref:Glyceraldehyde-3-phosphate dehydrogenase n=3 Tax=Saccharolobus solfataricus TaxID=2287 RepID=G3P_SACS2|nr:phosphorylating glyceraldehyde-3-phosphate dehydrogenase [Saccharolobus solfataricus]P39460.2 RecName: Full=Glyceraldehyde-3-phosphate dehydrogenase; Short=GAPDH; AltName: Full=NAD(P)-dependent glyceraldehyde-3-phosphate dehydrogenase [Saccharolobus solfataricus P2]AAK40848.1 Glyceraldehyde-3-phosphate dehydrogenase (GAPDH) (gap) [Saccharolobus solfataricus P2]AKA73894.1 phosphorylating glyceraldehyde-3-phosphate dehydrogenase [Saccharolobus solfataricus]AKA76592.1 phosphorylating glyceralde